MTIFGNFFFKCQVLGNFLTVKWQFSGGSGHKWIRLASYRAILGVLNTIHSIVHRWIKIYDKLILLDTYCLPYHVIYCQIYVLILLSPYVLRFPCHVPILPSSCNGLYQWPLYSASDSICNNIVLWCTNIFDIIQIWPNYMAVSINTTLLLCCQSPLLSHKNVTWS